MQSSRPSKITAMQRVCECVKLRVTKRPGKNIRSRASALLLVCGALILGPTLATNAETSPTSSELLEHGRKLLEAGKLAEAELVLDRAEKLAPFDPVILTLDAKVKGRLGEYAGAVDLLKRASQLTPKNARAHVDLAIALADSGDLNHALDETGMALSIDPGLAIAHLNRARILSDLKQDAQARDEFAVAVKLAPRDPEGFFYWSFAERAQGNLVKESELLRKVVALQPGNVKAHIKLADSLLDQGQTSEAVAELRSALAIDPKSAQALYKLSRAVRAASPEESQELRGQFDRLEAQNSITNEAKALANEAFHEFTVQNLRESIRLYGEALETCGDCEIEGALHRDLGLTLCRDGQVERGSGELRKALALNPEDRDAARALEMIPPKNQAN